MFQICIMDFGTPVLMTHERFLTTTSVFEQPIITSAKEQALAVNGLCVIQLCYRAFLECFVHIVYA